MASDSHAGTAMVALVPPYETSEDLLALAGREDFDLEDQHITMIYLPSTEGFSSEDLMAAVTEFAETGASLSGRPNGWGRFDTPDGSCQIALWDIVNFSSFREGLVATLRAHGIEWTDTHGSIAHQTMGYDDPGDTSNPDGFPETEPVIFGDIHVWYDDEHVGSTRLSSPPLDVVASLLLPGAVASVVARLTTAADDNWDHEDEAKHPRGNPGNPGQFRKKDGPAAAPKEPKAEKGPDGAKGTDAPKAPDKNEDKKPDKNGGETEKAKPKPPIERTPFVQDKPRTEEEAKERGDVYGAYLPAGDFPEGDPRNDPEFQKQHEQAKALTKTYMKASKEQIESGIGGDTKVLHNSITDPVTGEKDTYTSDRVRKHKAVLQRVLDAAEKKGVAKGGRMIIMAGPSGAGKSSFINQYGKEKFGIEGDKPADDPDNFVVINPDNFKDDVEVDMSRYPGLNENELAAIRHEESSAIAKLVAKSIIGAGYDVILDITLGSAESAERKYLDIPGGEQYKDVQVALVDGDMTRSRHNAGNRWKQPNRKGGTWERKWDGRFLDMGIIEGQKPTKEGYRSVNAEQFEDLVTRRTDRISKAWVFNPFDNTVSESTSPKHEGLDAREARLSQRLRSSLVDSINDMMMVSQESKSNNNERIALMSGSKKDVFYWIDKYKTKSISDDELVKGLTEDVTYKNKPECPFPKGTPEWYHWVEEQTSPKGSFSELDGQIPDELLYKALDIIHDRAEKRY